MSESKHTPAPWEWRDVPGAGLEIFGPISAGGYVELPLGMPDVVQFFHLAAPQNILIAYERWVQFEPNGWREMQEANARLMAAAPTMLEALECSAWALERIGTHLASLADIDPDDKWIECGQLVKNEAQFARAVIAKACDESTGAVL